MRDCSYVFAGRSNRIAHFFLTLTLLTAALWGGMLQAQTVTATVGAGTNPDAVAVNPVTNKIYVANYSNNSVTVIEGATNATTTVGVGSSPRTLAVNPVTNKIYVAHSLSNNVTVIDGATNATTTVGAGSSPVALAVNPVTNKIYVANHYGNNVTVIDGATNATTTVSTGSAPHAVAINPVTNKIYVANSGSNNVTVIDGTTNATTTVGAGSSPQAAVVNPVTNKIYIANFSGNDVTVIDGATNLVCATVGVGGGPYAVAVNPVTNKIYTANYGNGTVTVIDGAANATTTVSAGSYAEAVAVDPVTNKAYVINGGSDNVTVIDGATNLKSATVNTGRIPNAVAVNPVTNKLYVANHGSNNVTVIDESTNATSTVSTGISPRALAVNQVTNKVYVANNSSNAVTVIDASTNATTTVGVGRNPAAVAVNPVTNRSYIANLGEGSVTVIDGATNATTTVSVGMNPSAVAVNPVTNRIYVANNGSNTVTVIDGATEAATTVSTGRNPLSVAVNTVSNKIYVANFTDGTVTVIDGATNATATIGVGSNPHAVAVNTVSNKIYVANSGDGTVTVIDGVSSAPITVISTGSNSYPSAVAVNPVTNKVYVTNNGSDAVTVIDGATNATSTVSAGSGPWVVAVDAVTNKIYVANSGDGTVTVIDGATNATATVNTGSAPYAVAVNPVTSKIYVANYASGTVTVITPGIAQAIPLTAAVQGTTDAHTVTGNSIFSSTNRSPFFSATVTSSYTPNLPAPSALYYQLDTAQGEWQQASAASGSGANPANYSLTLSNLPPGVHTLYVFAGFGDEGTPEASGDSTSNSPETSNPWDGSAYTFLILPIATSTQLTADLNPQNAGSAVTFTAYVQAAEGTGILDGTVSFLDGTTVLGQVALDGTGHASLQTTTLAAGTHTVTAIYGSSLDYLPSSSELSEVVAGDPASITAVSGGGQTAFVNTAFNSPLVVYVTDNNNNPVPNATVTFSGAALTFSDSGAVASGSDGRASVAATPIAGGELTASASVAGASTAATFNLTANKLSQTITFTQPTTPVTYGVAPITLSATATSELPVSFAVTSGPATVNGTALTITGAGTVVVEARQPGDSIYVAAISVAQTIVVDKATASVTPTAAGKTYGHPDPIFTGALSGFLAGDNVTASYSRAAGETVAGGPYTISATLAPANVLGNYTITNNTASFTINKASASVTPNAASKTYGASDPTLMGTLNGFVAADNVTASYSRAAGETVAGGPYAISATLSPTAVLGNYTITYNPANFTIGKATASVTPAAASKSYGQTDPTLTGSLPGFVSSDNVTASYSRAAGETVAGSPYTISATLSPTAALTNYNITYNTASFTISKATASVTPTALGKTYGQTDPTLTGTLSGFVASDNVKATYSRTAGETVAGGPYPISATLSPAATLVNYNITQNTAPFTIAAAPLTVSANDKTRAYGAPNPTLDGTVSGVLNSDGITANYSTTAVVGSNVGTYPITATLVDPNDRQSNYAITNTPGTLTITPTSTTTTLGASSTNTLVGASVTFTATVALTAGTGIPSGTVTFKDGAATLGTGSLDATGKATYSTSGMSAGSHSVTAVFGGSTNLTTSTSANLPVNMQDFSLPAAGPAIVVLAGQSKTASFTITPISGFTGAISFSCAVPAGMTETSCSASSVQVTGASGVDSTLTVVTAGSHQIASSSHRNGWYAANGFALIAFAWLGAPAVWRRRRFSVLTILMLVLLIGGAVSCGGGASSSKHTDLGTPAGSYTLTVTATSGTAHHTMNVAVVVQ
jgi:YVTN family beta-propeller protein